MITQTRTEIQEPSSPTRQRIELETAAMFGDSKAINRLNAMNRAAKACPGIDPGAQASAPLGSLETPTTTIAQQSEPLDPCSFCGVLLPAREMIPRPTPEGGTGLICTDCHKETIDRAPKQGDSFVVALNGPRDALAATCESCGLPDGTRAKPGGVTADCGTETAGGRWEPGTIQAMRDEIKRREHARRNAYDKYGHGTGAARDFDLMRVRDMFAQEIRDLRGARDYYRGKAPARYQEMKARLESVVGLAEDLKLIKLRAGG